MSTFTQKMNLANFTLTLGSNVMLDIFDPILMPAFEKAHVRTYGESSYFFLGVGLFVLDSTEGYIAGRIVKNTTISRDQIFHNGKIVSDHQELASAPTSFFALQLSNHKLLFVRENVGAPSLQTFESTIYHFVKLEYRRWLREQYELEKAKDSSINWASVTSWYPSPELEISAIANEDSVSAYIEKFSVINALEIRLLKTNHELDNLPLFGEMRKIQNNIGASDIVLKTQKAGTVGLEKGGISHLIATPAAEGNSRITLRGTDIAGEKLVAQNESFSVAIPVKHLPASIGAAVAQLVEKLKDQLSLGVIKLNVGGDSARAKLMAILQARNSR